MESTNAGAEGTPTPVPPAADGPSNSAGETNEQKEQQQQQQPPKVQPSETALPRRSHIAPRDRFNNQSLGVSLNTTVKQV